MQITEIVVYVYRFEFCEAKTDIAKAKIIIAKKCNPYIKIQGDFYG